MQFATLLEILEYRAERQPNKCAYLFLENGEIESDRLTYQQLWQQAHRIACSLHDRQGENALLVYPSGLEFIAAFLGCLLAGVVAVPAYPPRRNQNLSRFIAIVEDAGIDLALTTERLLVNNRGRWSQEAALTQLSWLATDSSPLPHSWGHLPKITPDTLAFLQYTSGSTGTPKGVMVTHRNLMNNEAAIAQAFGHDESTIVVGWLPFFHDMGLIGNVLQPLYLGIPSILMSSLHFIQKPVRWLQAISNYRATTSGGPNFAYDFCVEKIKPEQLAGLDLSSWRVAFNGAEPVQAKTLEQFSAKFAPYGFCKRAFYPCYGMAETTLFATGGQSEAEPLVNGFDATALEQNRAVESSAGEPTARFLVSCGFPRLNHQIAIANPNTFTCCAEGEVGEIWVSGTSVAKGYWQRKANAFQGTFADSQEGSFFRTGDLGFLWKQELFIAGRLQERLIIRGQNHYPQDIELTVQQSHAALKQNSGAAFTIEIAGQEQLIIVQEVERQGFKTCDRAEVFRAINQAVSLQHGLDVHTTLLVKPGAVPKTSSGKIQRRACRQRFLDNQLDLAVLERRSRSSGT